MKKYAPEISRFISENVKGSTTRDLVETVNAKFETNFTESKMNAYKKNHKLKSGRPVGMQAGSPTSVFPEDIKKFIHQNHVGVGPKKMAELLNETFGTNYTNGQMKAYYGNHNVNSGLNGQFKPGHTPINKGKKGGGGGWALTQFKKGNVPGNYKPVGTERVNGDGYVDIKIADQNKWRGKHIIVWEEHNAISVPKGHVVIFGDGDRRNFDPNNLILITRGQLAIMNRRGLIHKSAELTRTGVIMADIYKKIGERKRKNRQ